MGLILSLLMKILPSGLLVAGLAVAIGCSSVSNRENSIAESINDSLDVFDTKDCDEPVNAYEYALCTAKEVADEF